MKLHSLKLSLFLILLLSLSCQKDDDIQNQQQFQNITHSKSTTKTVSGKDVPEVLNFIKSKSNNKMQFRLNDSNSPEGQFRSHEENLNLTTTLTEQIKQVTNNYGKSNYTFNLIEEETKEGVYFLNLVVKEYKDTYYLYITKYVPDSNWLKNYNDASNFSTYSGFIYFYSDEGIYLAKAEMQNGASHTIDRHQCDGGNDNSENSDTGGTGGTSDSGSSDGGSTSDSTNSSGSNSGGSGGWNIDLFFDCCWCGGDLVGPHDHVECELTEINNYSSDGFNNNASIGDFLRHPCDTNSGDCAGENDCEYGYDDDCSCLEEPDENSDVGILIGVHFHAFNSFINTLDLGLQDWINDEGNIEIRGDIFDFLIENDFSNEALNVSEEIITILSNNSSINFEEAIETYVFGQIVDVIVDGPDIGIENLQAYLSCFDTNENAPNSNITIYVDEPTDGSNNLVGADGVGHTFISIQQGENIASYGFYPVNGLPSLFFSVEGIMGDNSNTNFDVSLTINNISPEILQSIINLSISYSISNYDLEGQNCTDVGIDIANLAGLPVPNCNANPIYFFGSTPGRLGEYIRNLIEPDGVTKNLDGGISPNNNCN